MSVRDRADGWGGGVCVDSARTVYLDKGVLSPLIYTGHIISRQMKRAGTSAPLVA
jgi:hypothetical protein